MQEKNKILGLLKKIPNLTLDAAYKTNIIRKNGRLFKKLNFMVFFRLHNRDASKIWLEFNHMVSLKKVATTAFFQLFCQQGFFQQFFSPEFNVHSTSFTTYSWPGGKDFSSSKVVDFTLRIYVVLYTYRVRKEESVPFTSLCLADKRWHTCAWEIKRGGGMD